MNEKTDDPSPEPEAPTVLALCPFCGNEVPRLVGWGGDRREDCSLFRVVCTFCSTQGPQAPTLTEAAFRWNTRALEQPNDEVLKDRFRLIVEAQVQSRQTRKDTIPRSLGKKAGRTRR